MTVAFPEASRYWSSDCSFLRGLISDRLMLWKKASKRSKAPVAADIEIASRSRDEEAFRRSRLDLHCIRETGASFPGFIIGFVKPSNQPCWDFSFPLVSKAESAIRIKRTWSSGIAWTRKVIGNVFRCFTTSFAACTCSMVGLVSDDASIEAAEKHQVFPHATPS